MPPASKHAINTQTITVDSASGRILAVADIRGRLSSLNELAQEAGAHAIIHTGDFGFFGQRGARPAPARR